MKSVVDIQEERLTETVEAVKKLLRTFLLFTVTIIAVAALRHSQMHDLEQQEKRLDFQLRAASTSGKSPSPDTRNDWDTMESFYNQSPDVLKSGAKTCPKWARFYMIVVFKTPELAKMDLAPNTRAALAGAHNIVPAMRALCDDIHVVSSAQARNVAFRTLSRSELKAVAKVMTNTFSTTAVGTPLGKTRAIAQLLVLHGRRHNRRVALTGPLSLYDVDNPDNQALVRSLAASGQWEDPKDALHRTYGWTGAPISTDIYTKIDKLSGDSLSDLETRRALIQAKLDGAQNDLNITAPILNVTVSRHDIVAAVFASSLLLALTLWIQMIRAKESALSLHEKGQTPEALALMVKDVVFRAYGGAAQIIPPVLMMAPSITALAVFLKTDSSTTFLQAIQNNDHLLTLCLTLAGLALLATLVLRQTKQISDICI